MKMRTVSITSLPNVQKMWSKPRCRRNNKFVYGSNEGSISTYNKNFILKRGLHSFARLQKDTWWRQQVLNSKRYWYLKKCSEWKLINFNFLGLHKFRALVVNENHSLQSSQLYVWARLITPLNDCGRWQVKMTSFMLESTQCCGFPIRVVFN